ncbi:ywhD family protein [Kurthia sp. 11kri321]|uniref:YwhD family protein n=1 Tax=Kurthia sp. 11kri321 TaxID=1750719 RepID=UPI000745CAB2|nr:YwhD family protein [Kurthia sp. 11kri321]AMA62381.1 ywhD family protein [Kurthia sp. 11kri321]
MENEKKETKKMEFTIIKNNPTDGHKGFGIGSLSLENVSPLFIDVQEKTAEVDIGGMHARSAVERGVKFTTNREDSEGGKPYWLVWVTIDQKPEGGYYAGVTACEMVVNKEKRRGYKILADHVNKMDKSMKRHIIVDHMDEESKRVLHDYLKGFDEGMWSRSEPALHEALSFEN